MQRYGSIDVQIYTKQAYHMLKNVCSIQTYCHATLMTLWTLPKALSIYCVINLVAINQDSGFIVALKKITFYSFCSLHGLPGDMTDVPFPPINHG